MATHKHLLEQMLESGDPHPEVSWNVLEVRNAVAELGRLRPQDPAVVALVNKVVGRIEDTQAKAAFVDAWRGSSSGETTGQQP